MTPPNERELRLCPHDISEMETACADGMCPLCCCQDLSKKEAEIAKMQEKIDVALTNSFEDEIEARDLLVKLEKERALSDQLCEALKDISDHSESPFIGEKWQKYVKDIAEKAIANYQKERGGK